MNKTTNLQELREGARFTWGEIIHIHAIAEYTIVEYHPDKRKGYVILDGQPDTTKTEYQCYFNDKDMRLSTNTMDEALAECIAYKHEGYNSQAARYFIKMLKVEE